MSQFLDEIKKWHANIPFPPFRELLVKNDLKRLEKQEPCLKNLITFLDHTNREVLSKPEFSAYFPPNMADLFQSLSITTWPILKAYLTNPVFLKTVKCLMPVTFNVDMNSLPLVTTAELEQLIKEQCNVLPSIDFKWGDARYWLCPDDVLQKVLRDTNIDKEPYKKEIINGGVKYIHDCDNFAMDLAGRFSHPDLSGLAFGQIWLQAKDIKTNEVIFGHAINIDVNDKKKVRLIEPQNDGIYHDPKGVISMAGHQVKYYLFFVMMV